MESDTNVLFSRGNEEESAENSDEDIWDDTALIEAYDRAVSLAKEEVHRRMGLAASSDTSSNNVSSTAQGRRPYVKKENKKKNQPSKYDNIKALSASGVQWEVGMACQCIYHEDGVMYEAMVEKLSVENGSCSIKFIGYENIQLCNIDELLPTQGRWAQKRQIQEAKAAEEALSADVMDWMDSNAPPSREAVDTNTPPRRDAGVQKKPPACHFQIPEPVHLSSQLGTQIPFAEIPPPPPLSQFTGRLPAEESEALSAMLMSWYLNGFHTGYFMGLKKGKESSPPRK